MFLMMLYVCELMIKEGRLTFFSFSSFVKIVFFLFDLSNLCVYFIYLYLLSKIKEKIRYPSHLVYFSEFILVYFSWNSSFHIKKFDMPGFELVNFMVYYSNEDQSGCKCSLLEFARTVEQRHQWRFMNER